MVEDQALAQRIAELSEDPEELELLFRADESAFIRWFPRALIIRPDAILLRAWSARLRVSDEGRAETTAYTGSTLWWFVICLCAISGTIAKLPVLFHSIGAERFYSRNFAFFVLPALAAYFIARQALAWRRVVWITLAFVAGALAINRYPGDAFGGTKGSDSITLACIHLPLFLWAIVGVAYCGRQWRDSNVRVGYLRLNGEAIINFALIGITGAIMTGITIALFAAIKLDIADWYFRWIAVYGAASVPIVATHLAVARTNRFTFAPLLARIFSPLALVTLVAYLGAMAIQRRSPYADREFLLIFNVMLVAVLAIAIFCICERKANRWWDFTIWALVLVALIIDAIALSAIVVRLASYGFTPNRTVTLVTNLLVLANLIAIAVTFTGTAFRGLSDAQPTRQWIARFLPVYSLWAAVVVFVLPWVFRFR